MDQGMYWPWPVELGITLFVALPFLVLTLCDIMRPRPWTLAALLTFLAWGMGALEMAVSARGAPIFGLALLPLFFAPHLIVVLALLAKRRASRS
jgi:hypothetical protein